MEHGALSLNAAGDSNVEEEGAADPPCQRPERQRPSSRLGMAWLQELPFRRLQMMACAMEPLTQLQRHTFNVASEKSESSGS